MVVQLVQCRDYGKWSINSFIEYLVHICLEQCTISAAVEMWIWARQSLPTKGLKLSEMDGKGVRSKHGGGVLSATSDYSRLWPVEGGASLCKPPPLTISWCLFLIRPQISSKTPKIPKIYTKTGDKGRVGSGEKSKERHGRLPFKVLRNSLQPLKSMWQISVYITKMWCEMKDAQDIVSDDKSKL